MIAPNILLNRRIYYVMGLYIFFLEIYKQFIYFHLCFFFFLMCFKTNRVHVLWAGPPCHRQDVT